MIQWLIPPPETPSLPVADSARRYAVRRILCVGQNYADHAREMGADPDRPAPFFFSKPAMALVTDGGDPLFPSMTGNLHHEVELVLAMLRARQMWGGEQSVPGLREALGLSEDGDEARVRVD